MASTAWTRRQPSQWLLESFYGEYLVLGDFRQDSRDSRSFGPINGSHIVGKAWIRYWPLKAGRWDQVVPKTEQLLCVTFAGESQEA